MCFSPTASFAVSGVLLLTGVASTVRADRPAYRMLAATPLLFAAQQAAEGIVWMTTGDPSHATAEQVAVRLFLGFALAVWPAWVPISLLLAERQRDRRRALTVLSAVGAGISAVAVFLLLYWRPSAQVEERSMSYIFGMPTGTLAHLAILACYFTPVVLPFFVSSGRLMRTIGVLLIVAVLAAAVIRAEALTSVWCFFAAMLSGLVLVAVSSRMPEAA